MIPRIITDTSITFIAQGRPWIVAADHPAFDRIKGLLSDNFEDGDALVRIADVRVAVDNATQGKAILTDEGLFLEGEKLSSGWAAAAAAAPDSMKVLLVKTGDRVRVEGDEDAPDGVYTVGELDDADTTKRVYVESEEDYFGFVANTSIKEIIKDEIDPS